MVWWKGAWVVCVAFSTALTRAASRVSSVRLCFAHLIAMQVDTAFGAQVHAQCALYYHHVTIVPASSPGSISPHREEPSAQLRGAVVKSHSCLQDGALGREGVSADLRSLLGTRVPCPTTATWLSSWRLAVTSAPASTASLLT